MGAASYLLLTGATGFLGRHLLRELLAAGRRVALLVRDPERGRELDADVPVLAGDLRSPRLGLTAVDRAWIARHCASIIHAAADVSFRAGQAWTTNVDGTARLLELGVAEFHHVSTAFVCGDRPGPIREDELDAGQQFRNEYEHSKFEAERRVRAANLLSSVYRPSVIVGDSRDGATTSYHGFYLFLQAAHRLAAAGLNYRLPFTGDERRNLVPVDWVAGAIVRLMQRPPCHGRTFHLASPAPIPVRLIKSVANELLGTAGLRFDPTRADRRFLRMVGDYEPYLQSDPEFDCRNTLAALPDFAAPAVDGALLARLIQFAIADGWGRPAGEGAAIDCGDYIERFLPAAVRRSVMRDLPLDIVVGLAVRGAGRWLCRWAGGELIEVRRGSCRGADVTFRFDPATFSAVARNRLSPQDAFLARRIEIDGDIARGLKLAALFAELVREFPYEPAEAAHGVACAG